MKVLDKEFLHEQLIDSLSLYSESSLSSLRVRSHMRVIQAPIISGIFKKISKEQKPSERELREYEDCNNFEEKIFHFSIINQCSIFDAFITDIETILILLEHKNKLNSITTSVDDISSLDPDKIILKSARTLAKKNTFEGIKKRLSNIYSNYKLKNRPEISLFEACERIFQERHALVHAPFSFTENSEKKEWDPFGDSDAILREKESTLGRVAYSLCKQVLEQKFDDSDQPMLILIKQQFSDQEELDNEAERIFGNNWRDLSK